jgi:hypothetical protein
LRVIPHAALQIVEILVQLFEREAEGKDRLDFVA